MSTNTPPLYQPQGKRSEAMSTTTAQARTLLAAATGQKWHREPDGDDFFAVYCDKQHPDGINVSIACDLRAEDAAFIAAAPQLVTDLADRVDLLEARLADHTWRDVHRELATLLGAVSRGRDHCDAMLVIAAIKHTFRITAIAVTPDASEVHITTEGGEVHRVLMTLQEEIA